MKKQLLLLLLLCNGITSLSQEKKNYSKLGLSIPIILNTSEGVYYTLGNRREPKGSAISYGANINYSHFFYKNLFIIGGVGYYKQRFNIQRPFQYRTPNGSEPLVSTNKYSYQNIQILVGLGYQKMVNEKWSLTGQVNYNMYRSYRQKYQQEYSPGTNEVYKKNFAIGRMINMDFRCERYLKDRISIAAAITFPFYTRWNDDEIFNKYDYSDDTQIIAYPKFSYGTTLSLFYQLKNNHL